MIKIFKLGGYDFSREDIINILTKTRDDYESEEEEDNQIKCDNKMLDAFLDGLIIFHRGKQKENSNQPKRLTLLNNNNVNNVLLKKVRIALTLTSHDMHEIFGLAGITMSDSELSAIFRREDHKNYQECGDKFARNFLKGLALKYR